MGVSHKGGSHKVGSPSSSTADPTLPSLVKAVKFDGLNIFTANGQSHTHTHSHHTHIHTASSSSQALLNTQKYREFFKTLDNSSSIDYQTFQNDHNASRPLHSPVSSWGWNPLSRTHDR